MVILWPGLVSEWVPPQTAPAPSFSFLFRPHGSFELDQAGLRC